MAAVNDLMMKRQWLCTVPTALYSLIGGSLSDDFGKRKPLIYMPLLGGLLAVIMDLFIYIFIDQLPVEIYYATTSYHFLGGSPIYYMGVYGFGATITSAAERAERLAKHNRTACLH